LADAASDRDRLRQAIAPKGAVAVIPTIHPALARTRATTTVTLSAALIECCFSKLKQFRRAATRFEKTARN
jgi:transposase